MGLSEWWRDVSALEARKLAGMSDRDRIIVGHKMMVKMGDKFMTETDFLVFLAEEKSRLTKAGDHRSGR